MSSEIKNKLFSSQLNPHIFHCLLCPSGHGGYIGIFLGQNRRLMLCFRVLFDQKLCKGIEHGLSSFTGIMNELKDPKIKKGDSPGSKLKHQVFYFTMKDMKSMKNIPENQSSCPSCASWF